MQTMDFHPTLRATNENRGNWTWPKGFSAPIYILLLTFGLMQFLFNVLLGFLDLFLGFALHFLQFLFNVLLGFVNLG